jgi:hypothetical protein
VSAGGSRSFHSTLSFLDLGEVQSAVHFVLGDDPRGSLSGPLGAARAPLGGGRFAALVQAGASYSELGGAPFLRTAEAAAAVTIRPQRDNRDRADRRTSPPPPKVLTSTRITLDVQDRAFFREHRVRSGEQVTVELSELVHFTRRGIDFRVSLLGGDRSAREAFSESFVDAGADLLLPLTRQWSLRFAGGWRRDDYDHRSSNLFDPDNGSRRQDETWRGAVALTWEISQHLRGTARATAASRNSNVDLGPGQPDLDYRRATAALGLSWVF